MTYSAYVGDYKANYYDFYIAKLHITPYVSQAIKDFV